MLFVWAVQMSMCFNLLGNVFFLVNLSNLKVLNYIYSFAYYYISEARKIWKEERRKGKGYNRPSKCLDKSRAIIFLKKIKWGKLKV